MQFQRFFKICSIIMFFVFYSVALCAEVTEEQKIKLLKQGDIAPVNVLREAVSGSEMTFPEKEKWNIIFYWSLFCHSCLQEIPAVVKRLTPEDDYKVFFVSLDSEKMEKGLKNFALKRKLGRPLLMEKLADGKYLTADQWGVVTTPSVFVVGPDGKIAFSHAGPMEIEKFFSDFKELKNSATEKK